MIGFDGTSAQQQDALPDALFVFNQWNDALKSLSHEKVAACYADDAILLPTLSNKVRINKDDIKSYFIEFLKRKPQGFINTQIARKLGENLMTHSGVYRFLFDGKESTSTSARFSFVYRKDNDAWKIIEHHSSLMPEPEQAA